MIKEEFPVMFAHPRDSRGGPTGQTDLPTIKVVMEGAEKNNLLSSCSTTVVFHSSLFKFVYIFRWVLEYVGLSRKRVRIVSFSGTL